MFCEFTGAQAPSLSTREPVSAVVRHGQLSRGAKSRIMYMERKDGLVGPARIGRVTFSKTGKTLHYRGREFRSIKGRGFKSNYFDVETGEQFWISGPRRDGGDRLYGERLPVEVDEDVRDDYRAFLAG